MFLSSRAPDHVLKTIEEQAVWKATNGRPACDLAWLPRDPAQPGHGVEVGVAAQHGKPVLDGEGGNPAVIRGDRTAALPERNAKAGIGACGGLGNREHLELRQVVVEPGLVGGAVPGPGDTGPELSDQV